MAGSFSGGGAALGFMQLGLGFLTASAEQEMGAYQQRIADFNARMGEKRAALVIEKAGRDSNLVRRQGEAVLGKQRVSIAGQGIELGSGSALALQEETMAFAAEDARMVENNAYLEAMGIKYQAQDTRNQGSMARVAAQNRANTTLVNAGLDGAMTYQRFAGNGSEPMTLSSGRNSGVGSGYLGFNQRFED